MKCDTCTAVLSPPLASNRPLHRVLVVVGWLGAVAAFGIGCSTRVPVEPNPEAESDTSEELGGAFTPKADAAHTLDDTLLDASLTNPEPSGDDVTLDGSINHTATSPTVGLPATASGIDTSTPSEPVPSSATSHSITDVATPAPIPTRQLSIPLPDADVKFAVLVSVDGLAARFLEQVINSGGAAAFAKLQTIAAWTHNARTDKTHTYTLPNHTCMLTGLPVQPVPGLESYRAHFYTANSDPAPDANLHQLRFPDHTYTPSLFDVAHDNGLKTAMFASKTKFSLFSQTYNDAGEPDTLGVDNGTQKIDHVVIDTDAATMVAKLVTQLRTLPPHLTFVHLHQPDTAGHSFGWGSAEYLAAVAAMDTLVGQILTAVQEGQMRGRTALIVTTDHGGVDYSHLGADDARNYQIPFYVFAPGVAPGDVYASLEHRVAPGAENPGYDALGQPLRNGDAGNLALDLLGLAPIPDSVIHSAGLLTTF